MSAENICVLEPKSAFHRIHEQKNKAKQKKENTIFNMFLMIFLPRVRVSKKRIHGGQRSDGGSRKSDHQIEIHFLL